MSVYLPEPAMIRTPWGPNPDIHVKGKGRFVAFALVPESPKSEIVFGGRFPNEAEAMDFVMPLNRFNFDFAKWYDGELELAPGRYDLYLIPDRSPVTITLRLHGLQGTTTVSPSTPVDSELAFPPSRLRGTTGENENVYWGGHDYDLKREGILFNALWLRTTFHLSGQYQFCYYERVKPIEPVAYAPGCLVDGRIGLANDRYVMASPDTKLLFEGFGVVKPGPYGLGVWYATQSVVEEAGYLTLAFEVGNR